MTRATLAVCVVLAWALARRAPSARQRAIAGVLTGLLAVDVVRLWTRSWPAIDVAPFALWYAVTAGAVWSVLLKSESPDRGWLVDVSPDPGHARVPSTKPGGVTPRCSSRFGPTPILLAAVVLASPIAYRHGVDVPRVAFDLALAAQILAALRFLSRGRWPDDAQRVALLLAFSSLADVFGPWFAGQAAHDWRVGKWPAVLTWICVAGWEARCLTRARSGPRTS